MGYRVRIVGTHAWGGNKNSGVCMEGRVGVGEKVWGNKIGVCVWCSVGWWGTTVVGGRWWGGGHTTQRITNACKGMGQGTTQIKGNCKEGEGKVRQKSNQKRGKELQGGAM